MLHCSGGTQSPWRTAPTLSDGRSCGLARALARHHIAYYKECVRGAGVAGVYAQRALDTKAKSKSMTSTKTSSIPNEGAAIRDSTAA